LFAYSAVGAGDARDATASPRKIFGQIWLDLGKTEAKFGQK